MANSTAAFPTPAAAGGGSVLLGAHILFNVLKMGNETEMHNTIHSVLTAAQATGVPVRGSPTATSSIKNVLERPLMGLGGPLTSSRGPLPSSRGDRAPPPGRSPAILAW